MEIQLELNIDNKNPEEMRIYLMQKQINEMNESMGKVRRKLFSEMGEMKKSYEELKKENENLKLMFRELTDGKTEWSYEKDYCLFNV